jgi:hypothetical protein
MGRFREAKGANRCCVQESPARPQASWPRLYQLLRTNLLSLRRQFPARTVREIKERYTRSNFPAWTILGVAGGARPPVPDSKLDFWRPLSALIGNQSTNVPCCVAAAKSCRNSSNGATPGKRSDKQKTGKSMACNCRYTRMGKRSGKIMLRTYTVLGWKRRFRTHRSRSHLLRRVARSPWFLTVQLVTAQQERLDSNADFEGNKEHNVLPWP